MPLKDPLRRVAGLIGEGDWVVAEVARQEAIWESEGIHLETGFNLSPRQLWQPDLVFRVLSHLERAGADPSRIVVEITETAAIASFSQANRFIHALKDLGCRFALDDFGTGLSSFGYLKHFPVDFLKIDGSFVKEILHDPIDREMVRSINEIGHLTGKQTIAEFAENVEIIEMLRSLGVDYAQGYGIATPQRVMKLASGSEAF